MSDKKSVLGRLWNGIRNVGMVVAIPVNLLCHFGKYVFSKDFWKDGI